MLSTTVTWLTTGSEAPTCSTVSVEPPPTGVFWASRVWPTTGVSGVWSNRPASTFPWVLMETSGAWMASPSTVSSSESSVPDDFAWNHNWNVTPPCPSAEGHCEASEAGSCNCGWAAPPAMIVE